MSAAIAVEPEGVAPLIPVTRPGELPTSRDLLLQALLHLPRIARPDGTVEIVEARDEIERLRAIRAEELAPLRGLAQAPEVLPKLSDLEVRLLGRDVVAPVLSHFHYLRSLREDGVTVGVLYTGRIVALCTVSPLDLPVIAAKLPVLPAEGAVVSRVFVFDWAPRNIVSYLLARTETCRFVADEDVRMLLTYVNPNMGFTGASYRAANWLPLGLETGTRYAYLDGRYITERQLQTLPPRMRGRVEYSRMPLRPLVLFCRLLDKRLQRAHPNGFDIRVERQEPIRTPAIQQRRTVTDTS
jgi:hypothetical protein